MTDPHFISHSPEFEQVTGKNPKFTTLIHTNAHEGPVYRHDENALYFLTGPIPTSGYLPDSTRVSVNRLDLSGHAPLPDSALMTISETSNLANGMTTDLEGRFIVCEQGTKITHGRISRVDPSRPSIISEVLVDKWRGIPFNSPNDAVVSRDGCIWFTDPSYGALQDIKNPALLGDFVYKFNPKTFSIDVVEDSFNKPNGLAFSPEESILYIGDSGAIQEPGSYHVNLPHHIRAFDVVDGTLRNGRLFAVVSPGIPDGIKVDSAGRVYSSSSSGVQVFNPFGALIGEIVAPGAVNFTFGGLSNTTLYILGDSVIWAAHLAAQGLSGH